MKNTYLIKFALMAFSACTLQSCAAGSLTAGYAARSNVAEGLTSEGEQKIIDRAKREIRCEIKAADADGNL